MQDKKAKEELLLNRESRFSEDYKNINVSPEKYSIEFFSEIFNLNNITTKKSLDMYLNNGNEKNLLKVLDVNYEDGLNMDNIQSIENRISKYGKNDPILREPQTLFALILKCLEDDMLKVLLVASVVSLIIGVAEQGLQYGWIEGFSIFLAVFIVVTISSLTNLSKEKQFAALYKENQKKFVNVRRNKKKVQISSSELLVGDILYLEIGNVIEVDCILLDGYLEIDEKSLTGESKLIKKDSKQNPFLISGSEVNDGEGHAVVCAIGENSFNGKAKLQLTNDDEITPLQERLEVLAQQISNLGMGIGVIIFLVMVGKEMLIRIFNTDPNADGIFSSTMLDVIVTSFIISITVIVVAIPEGLPMAVCIALGYSVIKLKGENNLVRRIEASETMGNVNNICTDKTGTLTEGKMFVRSLFIEGNEPKQDNFLMSDGENKKLLIESIVNNISAYVEFKKDVPEYKGNSTEASLLRYLVENKVSLDKFTYNEKEIKTIQRIPFKSLTKYMGSIYFDKSKNIYKFFIKGAPEVILNISSQVKWIGNKTCKLSEDIVHSFNSKCDEYANRAERTLAFSYFELKADLYDEMVTNGDVFEQLMFEKSFILIGLVGIADPPRSDVKEAILKSQNAGVFVRMVTGDNIHTALSIAKEVCIINDYEFSQTKRRINESKNLEYLDNDSPIFALEGPEFKKLTGGFNVEEKERDKEKDSKKASKKKKTDKKKIYKLNNPEMFKKVIKDLKVIARCSPEDKFLLVLGLKELKEIVAVTGDGTNDAPALKKSDVGFAMGSGTDIAKDASDIVILNNSFGSVVNAIKYGRNVYDCIRKFIQFQLTTNIVACFMTLLGGFVLSDAPLNAVQMLWVNLIMDSLASLALSTEDPTEELLNRKPYPRGDSIVTKFMIRNIISQACFQIVVLTIFLFYGDVFFGVPSDRNLSHFEWNEENGYHFTLFFDFFIFLQIFNSINSRKLEQSEVNVFENIGSNNIYLAVQAFIFFCQIIMVQFGGRALRLKSLSFRQHLACLILASTCLPFGYLVKVAPFFQNVNIEEKQIMDTVRSYSISLENKVPSRGRSFKAVGINHNKAY